MKWITGTCAAALLLLMAAGPDPSEEQLQRYRNLGKAFYENPTTQAQAVDEFKKALDLRPKSATERLNYGLALIRAGKTKEGIAELERVQKKDPKLPHTWFNLGIELKKLGDYDRSIPQFERMVELVPDEPVSYYNLGVLYKLAGRIPDSIKRFEKASQLDPNLAAPHFQLYNAYRQAGRREDAARELQIFQTLKKQQEGAAIPEDMEWSFYSEVYDVVDPKLAAADAVAPVAVRVQPRKLPGAALKGGKLALADIDGDGKPDLIAAGPDGIRIYRSGSLPVQNTGLGAVKGVIGVAPNDFNNDGLTDLCILTESGPLLYSNAKGSFRKQDAPLPAQRFDAAVWLDYDRDYDLDLFLLGPKAMVFRNEGTAGFADRTPDFPFVTGHAIEGAGFRVIADSKAIDLLVSYQDRAGVLYRDQLGGKYKATDIGLPANAHSLTPYDLNNDGWIDIASSAGLLINRAGRFEKATVPWSAPLVVADIGNTGFGDVISGAAVYQNRGLANFEPAKTAGLTEGTDWVAADFNSDGKLDLATISAEGAVTLFSNVTASSNQWLRVGLTGVKTAKLAPYSEVEVKAGVRYQKQIYRGLPLHFGLRGYKTAETIRITWPNGLIQNEMKQVAGIPKMFKEAQRLSGSCPIIWTWNGREFEYITDVLGVAPLGASSGNGEYFPVDHDEYVRIPGKALRAVDGKLEVRITEELAEVTYLDQAQLIAVDHPSDSEIFTNEKFKSPPFPEFRLFGVKHRVSPVMARDQNGRDVQRAIAARDGVYVDDFPRTISGVGGEHYLDLDFGKGRDGVLVLSGWVDWADGSTFLRTAQEGRGGLIPPYLQVKDSRGAWRTVIEDMGMPAGKPKSIVVDLTGKWLSDSREVRIVTNLCVYWDEIYLSPDSGRPDVRLTAINPFTADLRFRGFSEAHIHPQRKQPESFFYARWSPSSMWDPTPGFYTRFGDVRELLTGADDRFVIMGSGDEVRLLFDESALPPLKPGEQRDYLLRVDGWAKDRDPNTAHSQTVEPLPFHGMTRYPYSKEERYPESPAHLRYRKEYNTRPALRLIRPLAERRGPSE
jgi:hypothetical protein